MNIVILSGRLTDDPTIRYTQGSDPVCIASFSLAVERGYKDKDGKTPANFFACKAFQKTAEFAEKYLHKGTKIMLNGRLEQERWTKDGKNMSREVVRADRIEFAESKGTAQQAQEPEQKPDADGFMDGSGIEEDLPFA